MPRELFIVARDRPDLYRYLAQTFTDAENVQVVWDRRADERRRNGDAAGADRQHADERRGDGNAAGADRQHADERRGDGDAAGTDRRHADRRRRSQVQAELRTVGYAFLSSADEPDHVGGPDMVSYTD